LPGGSYSLLIFLWHHFSFTLEHPVRASWGWTSRVPHLVFPG
jgi:hypothetical protein